MCKESENGAVAFHLWHLIMFCYCSLLVKMTALEYEDNESKFIRKAKENPFVPIGKLS